MNVSVAEMKEKKKFNADVSDALVVEVLKRKELLIENNTSRDLTFSENKRNAWNDVIEGFFGRIFNSLRNARSGTGEEKTISLIST